MKLFWWCLSLLVSLTLASPIGGEIIAEACNDSCPYPYIKVLDECYYPSNLKVTWEAARYYCRNMNGDMASPSSVSALHAFLRDIKFYHFVFLGGTNTERGHKEWLWLDGTPIKQGDWGAHQPNNLPNQHCVYMRYSENPPLHDFPCGAYESFVCQFKPHT